MSKSLVHAAWIIFLIQGFFYAAFLPSWEGFDEPVHMAYVAFIHDTGSLPVYGQSLIPQEIQSSVESMPVPRSLLPNSKYSFADTNEALNRGNDSTSGYRISLYEAQHPPLYYFLLLPAYSLFASYSIVARLFVLRFCSVVLASLFIFPALKAIRLIFLLPSQQTWILFAMVSFPGLYIDVARVGNDSLGLLLYTLLYYRIVLLYRSFSFRNCVWAGCILGLGLLTKMYFVPALIPLAIIGTIQLLRAPGHRMRILKGYLLIYGIGAAAASPWFFRCLRLYGVLIFTHETLSLAHVPWQAKLVQALHMPWGNEMGVLFRSFIWVGGWSFLDLPKSVYDFYDVFFLIAVLGLGFRFIRQWRTSLHSFIVPLLFIGSFLLSALEFSVLSFMTRHALGGAGGWYLYAIILPIATLLLAGLWGLSRDEYRSGWLACTLVVSLGLTNIYGVFFRMIPFYAGFAPAVKSRSEQFKLLIAAPWENFKMLTSRLAIHKPAILNPAFHRLVCLFFLLGVLASICLPLWQNARNRPLPASGTEIQ